MYHNSTIHHAVVALLAKDDELVVSPIASSEAVDCFDAIPDRRSVAHDSLHPSITCNAHPCSLNDTNVRVGLVTEEFHPQH